MLIEVDMTVGTETSAMATYRRAVAALREIGLTPDEPTVRLLRQSADDRHHPTRPPKPKVGTPVTAPVTPIGQCYPMRGALKWNGS